jgi:hypothetical protein
MEPWWADISAVQFSLGRRYEAEDQSQPYGTSTPTWKPGTFLWNGFQDRPGFCRTVIVGKIQEFRVGLRGQQFDSNK